MIGLWGSSHGAVAEKNAHAPHPASPALAASHHRLSRTPLDTHVTAPGQTPDGADLPFRALFDAMAEGVALHELVSRDGVATDYRILAVNPAFSRHTGLAADRVEGRLGSEAYDSVPPPYLDRYAEVATGGEPCTFESFFPQLRRHFRVTAVCPASGTFATVFEDITERKRVADDLRETRDFLENLLTHANAPIITWDPGLRITRFNPAFEQLTGRRAGEVLGHGLELLFPAASREESMRLIREAGSGERWRSVEIPILRADGEVRIALWNSATLFAEDGVTPLATIAQGQDITERTRAEAELRLSEDKFRYLFDHTIVGKSITYPGGEIHVNEAFATMLQYTREELAERPWADITHPDDIAWTQRVVDGVLAGERDAARFEKRYLRRDGETVWTDVSTVLRRDDDGRPLYFMTTVVDITEKKLAEERVATSGRRYRDLVDHMSSGVVVYEAVDDGADFVIREFNDAAERIERLSREDLLGRRVTEAFPGVEDFGLLDVFRRVWRTGVPEDHPVSLYLDGRTQSWRENYVYRLPGGEVVAVYDDVTERVRAQEDLAALNADLEQRVRERTAALEAANRELESFSYSVSHDLRAPLRHVSGFAELLKGSLGDSLDETDRRYLERITAAISEMGRLIDDLLAFSRAGRAELHLQDVDMDAVLREVLHGLESELAGRDIEWTIGPLPPARGDATMLRLVWNNLLDNAVKFTAGRAPARITVSGIEAGGECIYAVGDNGAGFDMTYVDKLFGVFERLHPASEFPGTGIGLANVRRLVGRMGGRVWAEGAVDDGATFSFSLPGATG